MRRIRLSHSVFLFLSIKTERVQISAFSKRARLSNAARSTVTQGQCNRRATSLANKALMLFPFLQRSHRVLGRGIMRSGEGHSKWENCSSIKEAAAGKNCV